MSFRVPERFRITRGPLGSDPGSGNDGAFILAPLIPGRGLFTIASRGLGWEHVSVQARTGAKPRTPTWEEMNYVKGLFWADPEDVVMQLHPRASRYVNCHEHVLHLWRPTTPGVKIPEPPSALVGPR